MRRDQPPAQIPSLLLGKRDTISTWLIQCAELPQMVSGPLCGWGGLVERGAVMGQSPRVPTLTPQHLCSMCTASPLDPSIQDFSWRLGFLWQTSSLCQQPRQASSAEESLLPPQPAALNQGLVGTKSFRPKLPCPGAWQLWDVFYTVSQNSSVEATVSSAQSQNCLMKPSLASFPSVSYFPLLFP